MTRKPEEQELVKGIVEMEARGTEDMHLIFNKIGQRLGFVPEETELSTGCTARPRTASVGAEGRIVRR
jgi:hypothetical protein